MKAGSRSWDARDLVIAVGVVVGVLFTLIELTGSDLDMHAAQTGYTALAVVLFTTFGAVGVALAHWQPRFFLFGAMTATLALLAGGTMVVSAWGGQPSFFGFWFSDTSGTVSAVTYLLAITSSAACVLLATVRPGEDGGTRLVRLAGIGALAFFVAVLLLTILDDGIDIGTRVYAITATVYVVATAVLLVLRLLPTRVETL